MRLSPVWSQGHVAALLNGVATGQKLLVGAGLGSGFDAAGQAYKIYTGQQDEYRPVQTLISGATGALAAPLASSSVVKNALLGGTVGGANTLGTNAWYGEDESVRDAWMDGLIFSGLGTGLGKASKDVAGSFLPIHIGGNPINPSIPILFQNFGRPNPYPGYIGFGVEQSISNLPSFMRAPEQRGVKP